MKNNFVIATISFFSFLIGSVLINPFNPPPLTGQSLSLCDSRPLNTAYAHNDYWHKKPLWEALSNGFTFIEVDIHLTGEELVVAHLPPLFTKRPKLKDLYLQPLLDLYERGALCHDNNTPLRLMIDIKTEAEKTYQYLKEELNAYETMLTRWENEQKISGVIEIIVSGNRPLQTIAQERNRLVSIDGRLSDLGKGYSAELMPVISDRFLRICQRQLLGLNYSKAEIKKLQYYIDATHKEGKVIRLWGTPEQELTWEMLLANGVDLINTDELKRLALFLRKREKEAIANIY